MKVTGLTLGRGIKSIITVMAGAAVFTLFKGEHREIFTGSCRTVFHGKCFAMTIDAFKFEFFDMSSVTEGGFNRFFPDNRILWKSMACTAVCVCGKGCVTIMTAAAELTVGHGFHCKIITVYSCSNFHLKQVIMTVSTLHTCVHSVGFMIKSGFDRLVPYNCIFRAIRFFVVFFCGQAVTGKK